MTYSIVARCPDTGMLGMAIATCLPSGGRVLDFVEPGVGVVASQARLLPAHGTRVLDGMRGGAGPQEALEASLALDEGAGHRQVGVLAADGRVAGYTGELTIPYAGHVLGDGFAAQANMMVAPGVPEAMAEAFERTGGHLAVRMLAALDAAEALGGDIRGRQCAAIQVKRAEAVGDLLVDLVVDARVDDDPEPLVPLRRLVGLALGFAEGSAAADAVEAGDLAEGERHYREALRLTLGDAQVPFWQAVSLAGAGHADAARAAWGDLQSCGDDSPWAELADRMVRGGLLSGVVGEVLLPPEQDP